MMSGIESKAGCAGVELESSLAWPLTPWVPLAGSPLSSAGMMDALWCAIGVSMYVPLLLLRIYGAGRCCSVLSQS